MERIFKVIRIKPDKNELLKIGFDKCYAAKGIEKHKFLSLKIYNLTPAQANIIKQTALSVGTDCAVHRETITGKTEKSDCILSGSYSELAKTASKLKSQPFGLAILSDAITQQLIENTPALKIRNTEFNWNDKTYIMGIVNATPDSFSDGGKYNCTEKAVMHALQLINDGADIIDIGGESTRPYAEKITVEEEFSRVIPVITELRKKNQNIPISIDTRNSKTAREALLAGADIINDVSACDWDKNMPAVAKEYDAPLILNHSKGSPDVMQNNTEYSDIVESIYDYFSSKISDLCAFGIKKEKLIIDIGIGFGKNTDDNFELIKKISTFKSFGCPILVGHSRKSFLQKTFDTKDNDILDKATNIVSYHLVNEGVNILRVHDVQSLRMLLSIKDKL